MYSYWMRPGNFWSYLLICAVAVAVAHAKVLPIGQQVAAVFQQVIDGFQGKSVGGDIAAPSSGGSVIPMR